MSKLKSNARRPCVPRQAIEALLEGGAKAPMHHALWLDALNQQLRILLPPALANRCQLANIKGEQLVLLADSPVWHAKLRLAETQILDAARSIGLQITQVTIKTSRMQLHAPTQHSPDRSASLSRAAHHGIREALSCLQDVALTGRSSPSPKKRLAGT